MARAALTVAFAAALLGVAAASGANLAQGAKAKVSPVQKVIQLIDDMASKVTKEDNALKAEFEEYAKFCDDQATEKTYAIKDGKEESEELGAAIADNSAKIESETAAISDLSTVISDTEAEISTATALREKEKESFLGTEKELVETVGELSGATKALKESLALLQSRGGKPSAVDREALDAVMQGLGRIVEASFVTQKQREHIQSFLEERADAEEEFEARAHTMDSNAIVETLQEMQDKAEGSLTDARKGEADAQAAYNLMKQSLDNQVAGKKKEMDESTQGKAAAAEGLATAESDLAVVTKSLAADTSYLKDLKRDCQNRARDFEVETKDNAAELGALSKAKAILLKKFASFVQTQALAKASEDEDPKARALRSIEQLGKRLHKTALIALAYRAAEDPFGKIRGMVEDMIAKLMQEAAEEATQKAFCDQEIGESTASKETKTGKLDKVNARLEKAESTTATLTEEITKLSKEVAESDAALAEATTIRQKEKSTFLAVEKDLSESEEACNAAMEVLREYYEGASLLQTGAKAKASADAEGDGSGILGVLEVAASDFATGLAEARAVETEAKSQFDKLVQESKMLKATKTMEIKGKQSEVGSLKTTITDLGSDKEAISGELDAVLAYLDKLKPQCETKVPTYAERKAAREQEIEGLKTALEILEAPALLQTGRHLRRSTRQ